MEIFRLKQGDNLEKELYYIVSGSLGLTHFDLSNDTMSSISASSNKKEWIKFNKKEAEEAEKVTGFKSVLAD